MAGIYIHIPFCKTRCSYCDFYKTTNLKLKSDFIASLKEEILLRRFFFKNQPITTLYFGGGTPSVLSVDEFDDIKKSLYSIFDFSYLQEWTVEFNPDDATPEVMSGLASIGVNRLSFGVQSFFDSHLKRVSRRHSSQQAIEAVKMAQDAGIRNISIDLIYGLPDLTLEEWNDNISQFLSLSVPHLSAYHLIYEEGTLMTKQMKKGLFKEATDDESNQQFLLLRSRLIEKGYEHYEISNFSLPGLESKHNSAYWSGDTYLGLGPSSHSFDGKKRFWNVSNIHAYCKKMVSGDDSIVKYEDLGESDIYNELIMLGLRTKRGIDEKRVESDLSDFFKTYFYKHIETKLQAGEIVYSGTHYSIPSQCFLISDKIISDLFYVE